MLPCIHATKLEPHPIMVSTLTLTQSIYFLFPTFFHLFSPRIGRKYAATQIQRCFRGWSDRMYVRPLVAWRRWKLAINVLWIASHHLKMARYRLRVNAKVKRVDALLRIGDTQEFAKVNMLRRHAAAFKIGTQYPTFPI